MDDSLTHKDLYKNVSLSQGRDKRKSGKKSSVFSPDFLLDSCLELMAEVGWDAFSLEQVAFQKDIPREKLCIFSSKEEILKTFLKRINQEISETLEFSEDDPFREALLESFMVRFEKLTPYKILVQKLYNESFQSPCLGIFLLKNIPQELCKPLAFFDKTCSITYQYFILAVYSQIFSVWLSDDSTDFAKTLSSLGRLLSNSSFFLSFFKKIS